MSLGNLFQHVAPLKAKDRCPVFNLHLAGLEIISRLAPAKLSGQTYFCTDTTSFWRDKYPLRHLYKSTPPPPPPLPPAYRTSAFSKLLRPVHTSILLKMHIFSAVLAFRPHVNGVFRFSKTVSRVEFFENTGLSFWCGRTKTEVFEYNDVIDRVQSITVCVLPKEKNQVWRTVNLCRCYLGFFQA